MSLLVSCGDGKAGKARKQKIDTPSAGLTTEKADAKKYPLEYGTIHATSEAMDITSTITTHFDDWGEKEAVFSTVPLFILGKDLSTKTLDIFIGKEHWRINLVDSTGTYEIKTRVINPLGVDMKKASEEILGKMNIKDLGEVEYLGYPCKKMVMTTSKGSEIEYIMYGNIMMQMQGQMMGIKTTQKVTAIDHDRPPAQVFEVPDWVVIETTSTE